MAFRATVQTPAEAFDEIQALAREAKAFSASQAVAISAGTTYPAVRGIGANLYQKHQRINELASVPGIREYAQEQQQDPSYEVITEGAALRNAIRTAHELIHPTTGLLPADGNDYVLCVKLNVDFSENYRNFNATGLAPLIAALEAIDAQVI